MQWCLGGRVVKPCSKPFSCELLINYTGIPTYNGETNYLTAACGMGNMHFAE